MSFSSEHLSSGNQENFSGSSGDPRSDELFTLSHDTPPSLFPNFADAQEPSSNQTPPIELEQPQPGQNQFFHEHTVHPSETLSWPTPYEYVHHRDAHVAGHL